MAKVSATNSPKNKSEKRGASTSAPSKPLYCSFCGKSQFEVGLLIAGPSVFICDECVDISIDILIDEGHGNSEFKAVLAKKLGLTAKIEVDVESLGFKPRFKRLKLDQRDSHCFYLCPFQEPFNTIFKDHLRPAVAQAGFTIDRADEIYGTQPIIEDIWESIISAQVLIADVTGRNPNVMYEIGMAHAVGKPVLIMTQDINDVPFDLRHYRCVIYSHTPRGCQDLEASIANTLRFLKGTGKS